MAIFTDRQGHRIRDRQPISGRSQLLQRHYPSGIPSGRQRVQEDSANPSEDGGIGADSQGQSQNGDRGEAGILAKHAGAIAQVLKKFFETARAPLISRDLLDERDIAEFAMSRTLGIPRGFPATEL